MRIAFIPQLRRTGIRARPDALFVFGDNLLRRGYGGQAAEARGEPNAVGVPTKKAPSNDPRAFLSDADYDAWFTAAAPDLDRIARHAGDVFWPSAGIGTGLAKLPERAPAIWRALEAVRFHFFENSGKNDAPEWRQALPPIARTNEERAQACLAIR